MLSTCSSIFACLFWTFFFVYLFKVILIDGLLLNIQLHAFWIMQLFKMLSKSLLLQWLLLQVLEEVTLKVLVFKEWHGSNIPNSISLNIIYYYFISHCPSSFLWLIKYKFMLGRSYCNESLISDHAKWFIHSCCLKKSALKY